MKTQNPPHRQHIVSKTVLRQFVGSEGKLVVHFLDNDKIKAAKPDRQAYIDGFIVVSAEESEQRWKAIEDKVHTVYESLAGQDTNSKYWQATCVPIILELIALHYVRSRSTYALWLRDMRVKPIEYAKDAWRESGPLMQAYLKAYQKSSVTVEERLELEKDFAEQLQQRLRVGEKEFRNFIHKMQTKVATYLSDKTIELGEAPQGKEFIISDTPAVLSDSTTGRQGPLQGVGVLSADSLLLPLNRQYVAAVLSRNKRAPSIIRLSEQAVDKVNMLQLENAEQRIFYHPNENLTRWVSNHIKNTFSATLTAKRS